MTFKCAAASCNSKQNILHRFPKDEERCRVWAERAGCLHILNGGIEEATNYFLCTEHFQEHSYLAYSDRTILVPNACPEIFCIPPEILLPKNNDVLSTREIDELVGKMCRICASIRYDLVSIFGDTGDELGLKDKIHTHLPIVVTPEDLMPIRLCPPCITKLQACHNLVSMCLDSDTKLRTILGVEDIEFDYQLKDYADPVKPSTVCEDSPHKHKGETGKVGNAMVGNEDYMMQLETDDDILQIDGDDEEDDDDDGGDDDGLVQEDKEDEEVQNVHNKIRNVQAEVMEAENELRKVQHEVVAVQKKLDSKELQVASSLRSLIAKNKKGKKKSKFQVVVVKMKNVNKLSRKEQISKALKVLEEKDRSSKVVVVSLKKPPSQLDEANIHEVEEGTMESVMVPSSSNEETQDPEQSTNSPTSDFRITATSKEKGMEDCEESQQSNLATNPQPTDLNSLVSKDSEVEASASKTLLLEEKFSKISIFCCMYCSVTVTKKDFLIAHQIKKHPDKVFYCDQCKVVVHHLSEFKRHLRFHSAAGSNSSLGRDSNSLNPPSNKAITSMTMLDSVKAENDDTEMEDGLEFQAESEEIQGEENLEDYEESKNLNSALKSGFMSALKVYKLSNNGSRKLGKVRPYRCRKCNYRTYDLLDMQEHRQTQHPRKYLCGYCNLECDTKESRMQHEQVHSQEKLYVCEYCGRAFHARSQLNNHMVVHGIGERCYRCSQCNLKFETRQEYVTHRSTEHQEAGYLCDLCGTKVKYRSSLRNHLLTHTTCTEVNKRFPCLKCSKTYSSKYKMKEHMMTHTDEKPHLCGVCGKRFQKMNQLRQHTLIHSNQRRYECKVCGRRFNRQGNMHVHFKRHQQTDKFTCKVCKEHCPSLVDLLAHFKTHSMEERSRVTKGANNPRGLQECEHCGKVLASKATLRQHVMTHTGERPFVCDVCGKGSSTKNNHVLHMRIHTGERPFSCRFCPVNFASKQSLVTHERIHTGEKPFTCPHCSMAFRCKMNLNQHLVVHSDSRPHQCRFCPRSFRRRDTLEAHHRTHTGERPYPCRICDRRFKQKGDCNKHEQIHLRDNSQMAVYQSNSQFEDYQAVEEIQDSQTIEELEDHESKFDPLTILEEDVPGLILSQFT